MKTPKPKAATRTGRALALATSLSLLGLGAVALAPSASATWRVNWSECTDSVKVSKYLSVSTCITRGDPARGYDSLAVTTFVTNRGRSAAKVNLTSSISRAGKHPVRYKFSNRGVTARKGTTRVIGNYTPCGMRRYAGVVTGAATLGGHTAYARM
jgi:hypothetical protein